LFAEAGVVRLSQCDDAVMAAQQIVEHT
jgi:hypothetical protein